MSKEECVLCGHEEAAEWVTKTEIFTYKGIPVEVPNYKVLYCSFCDDGIVDRESADRAGEILIKHQRVVDNLLQPEELKAGRNALDLTLEDFSKLIGETPALLGKYEQGLKAQPKTVDILIRLVFGSTECLEFLKKRNNV